MLTINVYVGTAYKQLLISLTRNFKVTLNKGSNKRCKGVLLKEMKYQKDRKTIKDNTLITENNQILFITFIFNCVVLFHMHICRYKLQVCSFV